MFSFHLYSLISSARLSSLNLDRWDALGTYFVQEGAILLLRRSLPVSAADPTRVACPSSSLSVDMDLHETGTIIGSGSVRLQSGVSSPVILQRFEQYHDLYGIQVQETKRVTK